MYFKEITPEEEAQFIENVAQTIHKFGMENLISLLLESGKPLIWLGTQFGRVFITPFTPLVSEDFGNQSEKFFNVFEKKENVDKLLKRLEELKEVKK